MSSKAEYDFYKSIGICVRCHKNQAEPNRVMCLECIDKESDRSRDSRKRNISIARKRDLEKYYSLKEQGICTYCKHEKAVPGKTKCSKCLIKIRTKRQAKLNDIPRSERMSYNICYVCGKKKTIQGKNVCEDCYKVRLSAIEKCKNSRKYDFNSYWKQENKLIFGGKNV